MEKEISCIEQELSFSKKIAIAIFSLLTCTMFIFLGRLIPQFKTTFENFGSHIPILTKIVVSLGPVYFLLAAASLLPLVSLFKIKQFPFKSKNSTLKIAFFIFLLVACYTTVSVFALYLPIFEPSV